MRIVFDSGSTKIAAALIDTATGSAEIIELPAGYNALSGQDGDLTALIAGEYRLMNAAPRVRYVYYYGAGCATMDACRRVVRELKSLFANSDISVDTDMLGAARAVCGNDPGIVGILGTGSNSCLYDGSQITANVSPLGYILGDEGSGAVLGRLFIGMLFKGQFPTAVHKEFDNRYHLEVTDIITRVYRQPAPNAFLASFAPFIAECATRYPEVADFLKDEFSRYVRHNLVRYEGFDCLPVHFVGSIARNFRDYLSHALACHGGHIGTVISAPIERLADYHKY